MSREDLRDLIKELQWENPSAHPHTLACLVMARWGVEVSGARVRAILRGAAAGPRG